MANLTNNRISVALTAEAEQQVRAGISMIQEAMPFLVGLTAAERITLPKINVSNKVFTEDAINAAVNNPLLLPSFVNVEEMRADLLLFEKLDELSVVLKQLQEKVSDSQLLAGSEAYSSALAVYKIIGAAADAGIEGTKAIYDQLKERFTRATSTPPSPAES
ncbi:hypothetical protein [Petrimonas sp.]|uniref:hypothetical protein n=1 Tax=Petrimonas sp. TaxID=2023866 RepID=UPI003F511311